MGKTEITGSESLLEQISLLKAARTEQEEALTQSFNDLTLLVFNPAKAIMAESNEKQSGKRELINISKIILNMGTDYIIEQSFGKRQKLKNFLSSVMIELISIPLINSGITNFFAAVDKHLFKDDDSSDDNNVN